MTTMKKERGRIANTGMGGFLNPPTHPEHTMSVETDLRRRPENRGGMSLSAAADCDYLDDATRANAQRVLADWARPDLNTPEIQDWIRQVLGYFRNCWKGLGSEPECWNVSNLRMGTMPKGCTLDDHAGVHLIRKYYPEYAPTDEQFAQAYWGKKPG